MDKLLGIICSQQGSTDEMKKSNEETKPSFMIFVPKKEFHEQMIRWQGVILYIQPNESTKLAVNSTELASLHLVVNRFDHWSAAVHQFQFHVGSECIQFSKRLARYQAIRSTFDQLPVSHFSSMINLFEN